MQIILKTSQPKSVESFIKKLYIPPKDSHKGQNGRVLIIGGSSLFHSASLWAAEVASHFADIVHYSSTVENNKIFLTLKKKFRNGIIVSQKDLLDYVAEDDAILVGPGMLRINLEFRNKNLEFEEILNLKNEAEFTYYLTKFLIEKFPKKKFVFDAGALQVMDPAWLSNLKVSPILTPHWGEYVRLFGDMKIEYAAKKYKSVILLKKIDDIISDGETTVTVCGGNQGLTKGGSGDVLAGLVVSLYAKNDPITSTTVTSYILKKSADKLSKDKGYWYNIDDLIEEIPSTLKTALKL